MPRRIFNFFSDSSQKSKHGNSTNDNQTAPTEATTRRRMSISRSGRFREQKHRSAITENTFSQWRNDDTCSKDKSESVGNENTVSATSDASLNRDEQWDSVNKPTVSYIEKKEAAARAVASQGRKETSI